MNTLKEELNYLKGRVLIQTLFLEKLIPVNLLSLSKLNINKTCQNTDIPLKIIKSNADLFAKYIFRNFNYFLEKGEFP